MKVLKWVLVGVLVFGAVLAAGVGGIIWLVFSMTQPVVDGGDGFLKMVGEGRMHEAYQASASAWRAQQDEGSFTAAIKDMGLDQVASARWNSRSIENNQGKLEGAVKLKTGQEIPIVMQLVHEDGVWRVLNIRLSQGGVHIDEGRTARNADEMN